MANVPRVRDEGMSVPSTAEIRVSTGGLVLVQRPAKGLSSSASAAGFFVSAPSRSSNATSSLAEAIRSLLRFFKHRSITSASAFPAPSLSRALGIGASSSETCKSPVARRGLWPDARSPGERGRLRARGLIEGCGARLIGARGIVG